MNQTSTIKFRPARSADIPRLCQLLEALFTLETDFRPDRDKQARALQLLIDKGDEAVDRPSCVVWVAEQAHQVVGMCSLQILISTAEGGEVGLVEDVIIDAAFRGQGLGRLMLDSLEGWAQDRGLSRLQLLVDTQNNNALVFYKRQGWGRTQMLALKKYLNLD